MSPSLTRPDSQTISIRQAGSSDATEIARLGAKVFTNTFGHSVQPHELQAFLDESYAVSAITKDVHDETKDIIVATDSENTIVGFAYLTRGTTEPCVAQVENKVELQRIYVDMSAHGKGIGRLLSSRIDDMAREQGFKNIWLGVWEENENATRAYEKWGYRQCGTHDFVIGSVVQTDNIMIKSL
ncbi:acyl-CoA N-acyltransferase [Thelonectria olida]|uniref:Acyl-CoA N-acyltransferase n=1 Tax=Thelonectria olida TaxID=1576542 RepID=A0A9P8WCP5_9HYPO|nr:acyl-CoA N-acyltransferase [Thelonectria olida]